MRSSFINLVDVCRWRKFWWFWVDLASQIIYPKTRTLRISQKQNMSPTAVPYLFEGSLYADDVYLDEWADIIFQNQEISFRSIVNRCCESDGLYNKLVCLRLYKSHTNKKYRDQDRVEELISQSPDETTKTENPCHSRYDTIKIPPWSKSIGS